MVMGKYKASMAGRAVINTPIQGGAADIVAMGMLNIHRNERLKELKWYMVLQVGVHMNHPVGHPCASRSALYLT